jgi:ABC-type nitrate/sulfonate/bicarbonate transport system ATPase subunit/predicted N-acetyltransferase YhbS
VLEVRDVTVQFDGTVVLGGVSLAVGDGEVVALLGPSGSGKSTLLRVIAGLAVPSSGSVWLDGRDLTGVPTHRRGIGMVFQDEQLFPHRSVAGNVGFGLKMQGLPTADRDRRVEEMLELVGLPGFGHRQVTDLSGGEAKRVALARSLAPSPGALLLDEPLTGLDRELHDRLAAEVARILRRAATTALVVTHDRDEAVILADRVVTMDDLRRDRYSIVELTPTETHPLRAAVLRNDTPSRELRLDGDDEPTTVHLGVRDGAGRLIAISTWLRRPPPGSERDGVQLRAMATAPDVRGQGAGDLLLDAGITRARAAQPDVVLWARARDTALGFYRRHGFEVVEPGFVDETTAIPHHVILLPPR